MPQERQYELVLLGATGYTGKLVAEWITTHGPEDLKYVRLWYQVPAKLDSVFKIFIDHLLLHIRWAIAGRNAKKLQNVIDELKQLKPGRQQPGKRISRDADRSKRLD